MLIVSFIGFGPDLMLAATQRSFCNRGNRTVGGRGPNGDFDQNRLFAVVNCRSANCSTALDVGGL
jgi:hypothetical protein